MSTIVFDSQLADVADEHEYRTGRRAEGLVFSIRTFALKATGGLGGLIGGFGLEIIDFPENATREMLTTEMLNGLFFMTGPLYWIIVVAGMAFMGLYNLNEKRHGGMIEELKSEARRRGRRVVSETAVSSSCGHILGKRVRQWLIPHRAQFVRAHTTRRASPSPSHTSPSHMAVPRGVTQAWSAAVSRPW